MPSIIGYVYASYKMLLFEFVPALSLAADLILFFGLIQDRDECVLLPVNWWRTFSIFDKEIEHMNYIQIFQFEITVVF